ncbi:hypothetical protein [Sphingomonas sp. FUKUSWIS1]|uniref:hypothetical protein n=1 Tax=Sphingomonas sp. FUKUSWIS1 TaxID=1379701 RepID=UPI0004DFC948|nr:hypothetical protein [Sphingomonas sp. FUKUSWIS1]
MTHYTLYSGGQGSFRAAKVARAQHPDADHRLVFTDTLYEDADTCRFLIESAANVFGRTLNWTIDAEAAPDYRAAAGTLIEDYCGNPDWRAWLAEIRERAMADIPELIWLVEGRDPWEVFRDRRYLGNSRIDPCSEMLKRKFFAQWRAENCDAEADTFAIGIGDWESHRFDDGEGGGVGPRMVAEGWAYCAPLCGDPTEHPSLFYAPVEQLGVAPARNYGLGYVHDNCGGMCVKGGQAHWQNRHTRQPLRFAYDAIMERKVRAYLGADVSILTDRRNKEKKPMTLDQFARRMRRRPDLLFDYLPGESGCGCMTGAA